MSSNKYLLIDSRDRTQDSSGSTAFRIVLPEAVHGVKRVKLLAVNMPNTVYNISAAFSNTQIAFKRGVTTFTAALPPGAYTSTTLPIAIAAAMNAVDSGAAYSCTYSATTFLLTIAATASFQILFSNNNSPWYECGFTNQDTTTATTITGTNSIQLGLPLSVYIEIPSLTMGMLSSRVNDRCTFVVPLNVDSGQIQYYADGNSYQQYYTFAAGIHLQDISVRVRTRNGQTLDLIGADWQMHLALE